MMLKFLESNLMSKFVVCLRTSKALHETPMMLYGGKCSHVSLKDT